MGEQTNALPDHERDGKHVRFRLDVDMKPASHSRLPQIEFTDWLQPNGKKPIPLAGTDSEPQKLGMIVQVGVRPLVQVALTRQVITLAVTLSMAKPALHAYVHVELSARVVHDQLPLGPLTGDGQ